MKCIFNERYNELESKSIKLHTQKKNLIGEIGVRFEERKLVAINQV